MTTSYEYDPEGAGKADDVASRIDTNGAFIGRFKDVHAIKSERTGTEGIHFEFTSPGGGSANFDVYTRKADGTATFGMNQINAMMSILGLRGLTTKTGKFDAFVDGKRQEVEGETFPDLMDKDIGLVLQKELYTGTTGKEGFRMNLYGIFHPVSRLTASEIKDKKTTPEKLEKMLRSVKTKDTRTAVTAEPAQPSAAGVTEGGY